MCTLHPRGDPTRAASSTVIQNSPQVSDHASSILWPPPYPRQLMQQQKPQGIRTWTQRKGKEGEKKLELKNPTKPYLPLSPSSHETPPWNRRNTHPRQTREEEEEEEKESFLGSHRRPMGINKWLKLLDAIQGIIRDCLCVLHKTCVWRSQVLNAGFIVSNIRSKNISV